MTAILKPHALTFKPVIMPNTSIGGHFDAFYPSEDFVKTPISTECAELIAPYEHGHLRSRLAFDKSSETNLKNTI